MLLAGLLADGTTTVVEPEPSRDHTERLLAARRRRRARATATASRSRGDDELELDAIHVPGDPSSAAFHVAAAVLVPGSRIVIEGMARELDPRRLLPHPRADGRRRRRRRSRSRARPLAPGRAGVRARRRPRPAASARRSRPAEVPLAIDELPLVALLGCFAEGETVVQRRRRSCGVKESDRIATVVDGLRGLGADIEATEDGFAVRGHRRPARRHASPPTATTAWRCSARSPASPPARASRSTGWRRPPCPIRASRTTSRRSRGAERRGAAGAHAALSAGAQAAALTRRSRGTGR